MRHRDSLIKTASTHVLRMQKALTQMNVQLHRVISDITGTTGMSIIRAILEGERNPVTLAMLKDPRIKASKAQIADALTGDYRAELLFVLKQEFDLYCTHQDLISACDEEIEAHLKRFEDAINPQLSPPPNPQRKGKKKLEMPCPLMFILSSIASAPSILLKFRDSQSCRCLPFSLRWVSTLPAFLVPSIFVLGLVYRLAIASRGESAKVLKPAL